MDKVKTTPKDFFLWAGAMLFLYVAVFNYIALLWDYINYTFPDPLAYYSIDPYQGGISWEMATLIVLTPAFLLLMWLVHRDIAADASRREVWIRRWALFLTLFIAGITVVLDLIYVLYAFLNGTDLTAQFLLKALVVLLVAAVGFMHFIADLWNYWEQYPARNRAVAGATGILVALTIIAGFFIIGTPGQARLYRYDSQKVSDLTNIQYQIANYWQLKQKLPSALSDLADPIAGFTVPVDPQTNQPYGYRMTKAPYTFELCATFNAEGRDMSAPYGRQMAPAPVAMPAGVGQKMGVVDNWQHGAGETCFTRSIDPERYPPINKTK